MLVKAERLAWRCWVVEEVSFCACVCIILLALPSPAVLPSLPNAMRRNTCKPAAAARSPARLLREQSISTNSTIDEIFCGYVHMFISQKMKQTSSGSAHINIHIHPRHSENSEY